MRGLASGNAIVSTLKIGSTCAIGVLRSHWIGCFFGEKKKKKEEVISLDMMVEETER